VKILAGDYKGHPFNQPKTSSVRPMSDKVRAALFDVVGPVTALSVLDAYAGSGAAGFEAISRGASLVEAIESNGRVARLIEQNAHSLGLDWGYLLHQITVETWLASPSQVPTKARYDLIIADPPYAKLEPDVIERLVLFLNEDGILALSHSTKVPAPTLAGATLIQHKLYGDTSLSFFKAATAGS
jgi:16S rRNA (guanine966-N2)-methyltransferase